MDLSKKTAGVEFEQLARKFLKSSYRGDMQPASFLKMPLTNLNDCSDTIAKEIQNYVKVTSIQQYADWVKEQPVDKITDLAAKIRFSELTLESWALIARMAVNLKDMKRSDAIKSKFVFAGLSMAGKTSLLNYYVFKAETHDALKTKPTLGMETYKVNFPDGQIAIWELGGQQHLRENYLTHPERFFLNLQELVYIVDMQDPIRFNESCIYLVRILEILKKMEENCRIVLLFHKADPNFKAEPAFLENHARLRKLFIPEIEKRKFHYVTRITSVYSPINELEENLSQVVSLDVISEILMKVKANQSASDKKSLKERVKQLFRRTTKQQDLGVSPEPDAITDAEFEVENGFQILDSEAFKALIRARNFDAAVESIEYFVEAWNNYKEQKKGK